MNEDLRQRAAAALRGALESHLGKQLKPVTPKDEDFLAVLAELEAKP